MKDRAAPLRRSHSDPLAHFQLQLIWIMADDLGCYGHATILHRERSALSVAAFGFIRPATIPELVWQGGKETVPGHAIVPSFAVSHSAF